MDIKEPSALDRQLVKQNSTQEFLFKIPNTCTAQCVKNYMTSTEWLGDERKCLNNCFDIQLQLLGSIEKNL